MYAKAEGNVIRVATEKALDNEVVGVRAPFVDVPVRRREREHDALVLVEHEPADLGLDPAAPWHLRERRVEPQGFLDERLHQRTISPHPLVRPWDREQPVQRV